MTEPDDPAPDGTGEKMETTPTETIRHAAAWRVEVTADRARWEQGAPGLVEFPDGREPRVIPLASDQVLVGRRSSKKGIDPGIDLSGECEDTGVSREHAWLVKQDDGSFAVVDLSSTNGTYLNDSTEPIAANQPVPLVDGDRIGLGHWTILTVCHVDSPSGTARIIR
jgi:FHA domain